MIDDEHYTTLPDCPEPDEWGLRRDPVWDVMRIDGPIDQQAPWPSFGKIEQARKRAEQLNERRW